MIIVQCYFSLPQAVLSLQETLDSVLNDLQGMIVVMKRAVTEVSVIATRLDTMYMYINVCTRFTWFGG